MKVLLVDDDTLVRKGLACLLPSCVEGAEVTEAASADEAATLLERTPHDLALVDIRMPGRDGLELLKEIRANHPSVPVIIVTGHDDPEYVKEALARGAAGYLLKDSTPDDLSQAIKVAMTGSGNVLSPRAVRKLFDRSAQVARGPEPSAARNQVGLTPRESDILRYLAEGYSNREISKALFLSEKTVKAHLAAVFRKLGVTNRTKAAMAAVALGLAGKPGADEGVEANGRGAPHAVPAARPLMVAGAGGR